MPRNDCSRWAKYAITLPGAAYLRRLTRMALGWLSLPTTWCGSNGCTPPVSVDGPEAIHHAVRARAFGSGYRCVLRTVNWLRSWPSSFPPRRARSRLRPQPLRAARPRGQELPSKPGGTRTQAQFLFLHVCGSGPDRPATVNSPSCPSAGTRKPNFCRIRLRLANFCQ
jgi:hypothetical protein